MSEDNGNSWSPLLTHDQNIHDVTVDTRNGVLYASGFNSSAYRSEDKGKSWKRIKGYNFKWGKRVCIGDRIATSVIEYTEPAESSGMTITQVRFAYDIELDEFVHDLELEEALQQDGKMDTEGQALFVKTNKGWRLENGW